MSVDYHSLSGESVSRLSVKDYLEEADPLGFQSDLEISLIKRFGVPDDLVSDLPRVPLHLGEVHAVAKSSLSDGDRASHHARILLTVEGLKIALQVKDGSRDRGSIKEVGNVLHAH